jgi:hypothetical protein
MILDHTLLYSENIDYLNHVILLPVNEDEIKDNIIIQINALQPSLFARITVIALALFFISGGVWGVLARISFMFNSANGGNLFSIIVNITFLLVYLLGIYLGFLFFCAMFRANRYRLQSPDAIDIS